MSLSLKSLVFLSVVSVLVLGKDQKEEERPRTFRRLIPADVLRDFPGVCFASTKCATVEPGETWELAPFCGRSTCMRSETPDANGLYYLYEMVDDCGPLPKANPKCKLSDKTNKTASFPDCCPIFECEPGVKLEYPDVTPPPQTSSQNATTTAKPASA